MALVEIENLTYAYGGAENTAVLRDCSLRVDPGEMVLLVGPSGCGKSTLLRAVNGLVPHFYGGRMKGSARIDGDDTRVAKPADHAHRVACVFQDPEAQIVTSTVHEEVAFALENLGVRADRIELRVHEALSAMGAAHLIARSTRELSGGEIQRVALAAALATRPAVLVLDEPTSQLDPAAAESLLELLRRVNEESGIAVIIAEHRLERCYHWADRVVVMADGEILTDAPPREAAAWSLANGNAFVPPVTRLFAGLPGDAVPLNVKEGRAELGRLLAGHGVGAPCSGTLGERPSPDTRLRNCARHPNPVHAPADASLRASAGPPAIEIRGLHFTHPDGNKVLHGCDLTVAAAECVAIMGDNGAGKSTLVRHLNGLNRSPYGSVRLCGQDTSAIATEQLAARCGLLGQNPNDYLFCESVTAELQFSLRNLRPDWPAEKRCAAAADTLEVLGIASFADAEPRSLSAGERQRVALAAVLVADPPVLVLDEPTRGMDWHNKQLLGECLRRLQDRGKTIVCVTHDVEFAAAFTDRVVVMGGGRILADGPAEELMGATAFLAPQANRVVRDIAPNAVTVEAARTAIEEVLGDG